MRTISLRQFRDHIADFDEPVQVQRRDAAGNFQILGEWKPLSAGLPAPIYNPSIKGRDAQQKRRDSILSRVNRTD
jgi:hypothetical protein